MRGALASLKSCLVVFICSQDPTVGTLVDELGNLRVVGAIGSQGSSVGIQLPEAIWVWLP